MIRLGYVRRLAENARSRPIELLFDIVFVLALSQVGALLQHDSSPQGILRAVALLLMMWWPWNQMVCVACYISADQPLMKIGTLVATGAFVQLALLVPEAFADRPGGFDGPLAFVVALSVVRLIGAALCLLLLPGMPQLRGNLVVLWCGPLASIVIMLLSLRAPDVLRPWLLLVAVAVDIAAVCLTVLPGTHARFGFGLVQGWQIYSTRNFCERMSIAYLVSLCQCLEFLETIAQSRRITPALLVFLVLSVVVMYLLWHSYGDLMTSQARWAMAPNNPRLSLGQKLALIVGGYHVVHAFMIGGILLYAVNLQAEFAELARDGVAGVVDRANLVRMFVGLAMVMACQAVFFFLATRRVEPGRIAVGAGCLLAIPLLTGAPVLVTVAAAALLGTALLWWDNGRHEDLRTLAESPTEPATAV